MDFINHDNKLIKGLKAGEEGSYNQLFNEYYIILSHYAYKYVKEIDFAREIVQDLFVHLYEIRNSLNINTSLKSYLYQSVRNRCLNHIKGKQLYEKHLDTVKADENFSKSVEDEILESELEHQIYKIVAQLPVQCQKVFKMSRFDGKKNGEIAMKMNISIRTVETHISKALKELRKQLHDYLKS